MKTKTLTVLLSTTLLLTACGGQTPTTISSAPESSSIESSISESTTSESKNDVSELEALGSIDVERELFDVTLNIPKDFVGETTQEELNKLCKESNFKSITLNSDGSATYVMTKQRHNELMDEYRAQINNSLLELIGSETYPNFTSITANEDFTEFVVITKSKELDFNEAFSAMQFYINAGLYHIFNGTEATNVSVIYKNADTGKIIHTENSSDLK